MNTSEDFFSSSPYLLISQVSYDAINWKIKIVVEEEEAKVGNLEQLIALLKPKNMRVRLFSIFVPRETDAVLQLIENLHPIRHVWQDENLRIFWPMQPNALSEFCLKKFFSNFAGGCSQLILHGGINSFRYVDIFYTPEIILCSSASKYIPIPTLLGTCWIGIII
uniref:Uncharacterized protein n=1 Tax=Ditylenchus dipsaci TaxID=166011 RepID=A0A915EGE3_9BILA